jgi:hypothetical protein
MFESEKAFTVSIFRESRKQQRSTKEETIISEILYYCTHSFPLYKKTSRQ